MPFHPDTGGVDALGMSDQSMQMGSLFKDEDEHAPFIRDSRRSKARTVIDGWRFGITGWVTCVFVVLFVNVGLAAYVGLHHGYVDGLGTLLETECTKIDTYNTVTHMVINILSTLLLSGSNYCMQCLAAPSRREINKAHERGDTVDIGIPSMRNLLVVHRWKALMWFLLAASSLPLHLFYNSVIYSSLAANNYQVMSVNSAFVEPGPANITALMNATSDSGTFYSSWAIPVATQLRQGALNGSLEKLGNVDCINAYGQLYLSSRSNLLLVVTDSASISTQPSILQSSFNDNGNIDNTQGCAPDPVPWLCPSIECTPCLNRLGPVVANATSWAPFGHQVVYCLSQPEATTCKLNFSLSLAITIIVFNTFKALIMLILVFGLHEDRIHTIGDAIASFLVEPNTRSKGRCLHNYSDFSGPSPRLQNIQWTSVRPHFSEATSGGRLWWTYILYGVATIICLSLLIFGLTATPGPPSASMLFSLGVGTISQMTIIEWSLPSYGTAGLISNVLVANLPQVILSSVYFTYNALFTSMLTGLEWSRLALQKKGLRVSQRPRGAQRSSYFLQLPYRYAIPLLALAGVLHWLVSQSIFLVAVERYDPLGAPAIYNAAECLVQHERCSNDGRHYSCGWSALALLLVVLAGCFMMVGAFAMGRRRYRAGMPLGGTDSAVISAACHIEDWNEPPDAQFRPLKWGVAGTFDDGVGHCALSTKAPEFPVEGVRYR